MRLRGEGGEGDGEGEEEGGRRGGREFEKNLLMVKVVEKVRN